MAAFVWGDAGETLTPDQISQKRKIANLIALKNASDSYSPVQSWSQGLARVANAFADVMEEKRLDQAEKANAEYNKGIIAQALGGNAAGATPDVSGAPAAPTSHSLPTFAGPLGQYAAAIQGNESGGNYAAVGPTHPKLGRALGAYQVMEANVGPWTKEALGRELTPDQFLADKAAQDAVFQHKFGQYVQQYGNPQDAASVWFTGRPLAQGANARDVLGTTGQAYVDKFNAGLQQAAPTQVASLDPSVGLPGTPTMQMPGEAPAAPASPAPAAGVAQVAQAMPKPTAAPAASASASPLGSVNPALISALTDPRASASTQGIAKILLEQQLAQQKVSHVDLGDSIGIMDGRGNLIRQVPKQKSATFGVIGKDPYGTEQYGFIDTNSRTTTPNASQGGSGPVLPGQPGSAVPAPPPGVDPKIWREAQSKSIASNALPADPKDEAELRKEVMNLPSYKNYAQALPIYRSMVDTAGRNSRASDLNVVYGLGKIMDPGSVVREGEMIMVKNTAGLPDWLVGAINSLNGGAALTPDTRKAIMTEAYSRMKAYEDAYNLDTGHYRGIAERNRANPLNVVPAFEAAKPFEPPAVPAVPEPTAPKKAGEKSAPASAPLKAVNPKTGETIISTDGGQTWQPLKPQADFENNGMPMP